MFKFFEEALTFFKSPAITYDRRSYVEGDLAYIEGKSEHSCPYEDGEERNSWMKGYYRK